MLSLLPPLPSKARKCQAATSELLNVVACHNKAPQAENVAPLSHILWPVGSWFFEAPVSVWLSMFKSVSGLVCISGTNAY